IAISLTPHHRTPAALSPHPTPDETANRHRGSPPSRTGKGAGGLGPRPPIQRVGHRVHHLPALWPPPEPPHFAPQVVVALNAQLELAVVLLDVRRDLLHQPALAEEPQVLAVRPAIRH